MTDLRLALMCAAAAMAVAGAPVRAQTPALETLLDEATAYAMSFVRGFENVVAEEVYVQRATFPPSIRTRTLKSEFLFVNYPGARSMVLRDVFEVDGKMVRDAERAERLMRLFTSPVRDAVARANQISSESARYTLGRIGSLNNPLIALGFLQPAYRSRFRFALEGVDQTLGPTVHMIRFQERTTPTVLRTATNQDLRAYGTIWFDEADGRVVKTRLQVGESPTPPEVVTTYRRHEGLGIDVPAEMRDRVPEQLGATEGLGTYSRFRRFEVRTRESIRR
jgi:hypothetical protein